MPIHIVRLGTARKTNEGLRIGTVRRPPRAVRKEDFARLDYFDVWLPQLAPSADLLAQLHSRPITPQQWSAYRREYLRQMKAPDNARLLDLLAVLSAKVHFSLGCYCEDFAHCHRSLLSELLKARGVKVIIG